MARDDKVSVGHKHTTSDIRGGRFPAGMLPSTIIPSIEATQAEAASKSQVVFSDLAASGTDFSDGDVWYQRVAGIIIAQWEFTSGAWAARTLDSAVIANLDASKITTGTLPIARGGTGATSAADALTALGAAPTTHAHTTAQVAGLDAALAGKALTTHTHVKSQITDLPVVDMAISGGSLVQRDGSGRVKFTGPSAADDGATKGYVDSANTSGSSRYTYGPTSGTYARSVGASYYAVYMDGGYEFGRNVSSRRYKDRVKPAALDVAAVLSLEPVTFHRKVVGDSDARDLGLIAEDSTQVPHLVIWDTERDQDGQPVPGAVPRPEAVRYETVLPVALLAVVKAQAVQIAALTTRLDALELPR